MKIWKLWKSLFYHVNDQIQTNLKYIPLLCTNTDCNHVTNPKDFIFFSFSLFLSNFVQIVSTRKWSLLYSLVSTVAFSCIKSFLFYLKLFKFCVLWLTLESNNLWFVFKVSLTLVSFKSLSFSHLPGSCVFLFQLDLLNTFNSNNLYVNCVQSQCAYFTV